jgi:hypothetical protein
VSAPERLTWLYCLVERERAPAPPAAAPRLPGAGAPRVAAAAPRLWLVAADVPAARYGPGPLERSLKDLDWVAACATAHEAVVERFARRGPTLPMRLFTLFSGDATAIAHVRDIEPRARRLLASVTGREEWGVRIRLSAPPRTPARARAAVAASGTGFLLGKKHEREAARAQAADGRRLVEETYETLATLADATRRRPARELDGTRLLLDATFLVPSRRVAGFTRSARQATRRLARRGLAVALTGPWPPYNFLETR